MLEKETFERKIKDRVFLLNCNFKRKLFGKTTIPKITKQGTILGIQYTAYTHKSNE
jgi:hypothetical protein